jgi:hypothetical protein
MSKSVIAMLVLSIACLAGGCTEGPPRNEGYAGEATITVLTPGCEAIAYSSPPPEGAPTEYCPPKTADGPQVEVQVEVPLPKK